MPDADEPDLRKPAPREPMEGGSDRYSVEDSAGAAINSGFCEGCDGCDFLQLSTILAVAALLAPSRGGRPVVALIRAYRRLLTRFTAPCPSTPSCSAYALAAVEALGPRRGLAAAAERVRVCGGAVGSVRRTCANASEMPPEG